MDAILEEFLKCGHADDYLEGCTASLLRFLFAMSPWRAEKSWAARKSFAGIPLGQWIRVIDGNLESYLLLQKNSGEYRRSQPTGVTLADMTTVQLPAQPVFNLRDFATALPKKFSNNYKGSARNKLVASLTLLRAAGNGMFERQELRTFLQGCYSQSTDTEVLSFCERYSSELKRRHVEFEVPGYYLSEMLLLDLSWRADSQVLINILSDLWNPNGKGEISRIGHLLQFIRAVLDRLVLIDGGEAIRHAAEILENNGNSLQEASASATSEGEFYGQLYESGPLLWGAFRGFTYLAGRSGAQQRELKARATVCEERFLRSYVPLLVFFGDQVGAGNLQRYQREIQQARRDSEFEADMILDQILTLELLYPPFWRARLSNMPSPTAPVRPSDSVDTNSAWTQRALESSIHGS